MMAINILALCDAIVANYFAIEKMSTEGRGKTKAYAILQARLDGILRAADALQITGYGNPQVGVILDIQHAVRDAGPRPPYQVVNNTKQHEYDRMIADIIAVRCFGMDFDEVQSGRHPHGTPKNIHSKEITA